jgi:hypothetical protein
MWVVHRVVSSGQAWLTLCPTSPVRSKLKSLNERPIVHNAWAILHVRPPNLVAKLGTSLPD